jgi:hypothetical protein
VSEPTHATLATFRMDPAREAEQREGLERMIVPGVKATAGFVTGCWTMDRTTNQSVVLITFTSSDAAEAFATNVRANAPHQAAVGIELVDVRIVEVSAFA